MLRRGCIRVGEFYDVCTIADGRHVQRVTANECSVVGLLAGFEGFECRARIGDGFVVGHRHAAGEQFVEPVVSEAFCQYGERLLAGEGEGIAGWKKDRVGGALEHRSGFVQT